MTAHFTTYNQPDGFHALEAETADFTEIVLARRAPAVRTGDKVVVYNTPRRHLAAVVTVTAESYRRTAGDNLERWPFAIRAEPYLVSDRGPEFREVPPGRANPRSIDDLLLARCERVASLNLRRG
jgi:hypothetical protein